MSAQGGNCRESWGLQQNVIVLTLGWSGSIFLESGSPVVQLLAKPGYTKMAGPVVLPEQSVLTTGATGFP